MDELQERRGPGRPPKYTEANQDPPRTAAKRKPFGTMEQKLARPVKPNFHQHWFNDVVGRIARAQEAGYDFVLDKEGKKVCEVVGVAESGGPLHAYLMELPEEWYQQDMAAQLAEIAAKEEGIKRGAVEGAQAGEKFYAGKEGISIKKG